MVERGTTCHIAPARVPDQMNVAQADGPDEICDVLHDRGHGVVLNPSRVVGITLTETVEREYASELRYAVEIAAPIGSTVGAQVGAKITAVQENDRFTFALLEVERADAAYIRKPFIAQLQAKRL